MLSLITWCRADLNSIKERVKRESDVLQKLQEQLASMEYVLFLCPGHNDLISISSLSRECQWQNSRFCCAPCRAVLAAEGAQIKASSEASREAEEAYSRACHEMQGGSDFLQAQQALQACKAQLLQVRQSVSVLWHRGSPVAVAPLFPAMPLLHTLPALEHCMKMLHPEHCSTGKR